ncbi:MAG: protein-arginine deiminase family protein [Hyalangium sp.]|uniref:protein-arginine deiminase family protein n=1 Tax=Hyalangium sp. TaxID=2028555 RepID=UPI00389A03CC
MDTDVYFFSQGRWFKTKVHLPDAELTGEALADHLQSACGLDPKFLFKVHHTVIEQRLTSGQEPIHATDLTPANLVLSDATRGTLKLQPGSLQGEAFAGFLPTAWGSTLLGPWLALPGWAHCERLFAYYDPAENHPFVYDLSLACHQIWPESLQSPADASQALAHGTSALVHGNGAHGLYLFNTLKDGFKDNARVQDQFQAGYCCDFDKHTQTAVALHFPRLPKGSLSELVLSTLPGLLPVCNDVFFAEKGARESHQSYGGNVLVSPPVPSKTAPLAADESGPAVTEHPPAPLGKLVVGDSEQGRMEPRLRQWLTSQRLQPLLPIDTSWLAVGHVSELVAFLQPEEGSSRVLIADPGLMIRLYELLEPKEQNQLTARYPSLSVGTFRETNTTLQREKFAHLRERLKAGLALDDESFIPIPVAFDTSVPGQGTAHTAGLVNLQVINGHALVPKPFGPRVERHRASKLLEELGLQPPWPGDQADGAWGKKEALVEEKLKSELMKQLQELGDSGIQQMKIETKEWVGYWTWARKGTQVNQLAQEHGCSPEELHKHENNAQKFSEHGELHTGPTEVNRVWIPSNAVDVLECYMQALLTPLGYTVHFIDTTAYHGLHGELLSGSNAQRTLPASWTLEKCQQLWNELRLHDLSYRVG